MTQGYFLGSERGVDVPADLKRVSLASKSSPAKQASPMPPPYIPPRIQHSTNRGGAPVQPRTVPHRFVDQSGSSPLSRHSSLRYHNQHRPPPPPYRDEKQNGEPDIAHKNSHFAPQNTSTPNGKHFVSRINSAKSGVNISSTLEPNLSEEYIRRQKVTDYKSSTSDVFRPGDNSLVSDNNNEGLSPTTVRENGHVIYLSMNRSCKQSTFVRNENDTICDRREKLKSFYENVENDVSAPGSDKTSSTTTLTSANVLLAEKSEADNVIWYEYGCV